VKSGRSYHFFVDGRYDGEFDESSAAIAAYTKLAPASSTASSGQGRLKLNFVDKDGNTRDKPFPQIVREYGRTAKNVIYSMFESRPRFDEENQTFYNAICEIDPSLSPKYDAEIDEWLGLLGQDKADLLRDWLAASIVLDNTISALNLSAPTNSGKNLIVNGLSRLWHKRYQNLRDYTPLLLKESPIVFCDEGLPYKWQYSFSTLLRHMTSQNIHTARDTGFSTLSVHGHVRLIFAGNDSLVSLRKENLSPEALEATMKRIVSIVHTDRSAKEYLEQKHIKAKISGWVNEGFARHVLWLNEHRTVDTSKRFMVEDTRPTELIEGLTTKTADTLFRWIALALGTSEFNADVLCAKLDAGKRTLYLHTPSMQKNWTLCISDRERPSDIDFRNSMKHIAPTREKITITSSTSKSERYKQARIVDLSKFEKWLKENEEDLDLDEALETLAKIRKVK
jgi:hypothetical protein